MDMEIDTIAEWDAICRICLQEGQLHSLFDYDDEKSDLNIAEKIMLCSPIVVSVIIVLFHHSETIYNKLESFSLICFDHPKIRYQLMANYQNKSAQIVYSIWM